MEHNVDTGRASWWRSVRWPALSLLASGLLVALAFALDGGSSAQRDAALIIGSVSLYILVPATVIWLLWSVGRLFAGGRPNAGKTS